MISPNEDTDYIKIFNHSVIISTLQEIMLGITNSNNKLI